VKIREIKATESLKLLPAEDCDEERQVEFLIANPT
jgi:hypothetical protein